MSGPDAVATEAEVQFTRGDVLLRPSRRRDTAECAGRRSDAIHQRPQPSDCCHNRRAALHMAFVLQRFSVTIQRGNTALVTGTRALLAKLDDILYRVTTCACSSTVQRVFAALCT